MNSLRNAIMKHSLLLPNASVIGKPYQNSKFSYYHSKLNPSSSEIVLKPQVTLICNRPHLRPFSWSSIVAAISTSTPVLSFQEYLTYIHDTSGIPWWCIILFTTLGIRSCVTFPFAVHQSQVLARLENIHHEMKNIAPKLQDEVLATAKMNRWDYEHTKKVLRKKVRNQHSKLVIRDNCHPFKCILLVLLQLPIWITFSFALRNLVYMMPTKNLMTELTYLQLQFGGVLWFTDFTQPDLIISVLLGVVNLSVVEMHSLRKIGAGNILEKISVNMMRGLSILVVFAACYNPSCVSFYWLCSSVFGFGQNVLLMFPRVRRVVNIPKTANESATPFKNIIKNMKKYAS